MIKKATELMQYLAKKNHKKKPQKQTKTKEAQD